MTEQQEKPTQVVAQPEVFTFNPANAPIRVQVINQEPWFVAKDVCDALTLENSRKATASLDDDEKGVSPIVTPSGTQQMTIVNESGLYNLIFQSRKPEAKAFRKWVTSEVLPAIRKTGRYELKRRVVSPRDGGFIDLRCEPYNTKWLGTTTVRVIEHEDVEWYSVADILRAMQVATSAQQNAQMLREANPNIVRKIFIFGNTHPSWFTTITGLRLIVSGSRKLRSHSKLLQLKEGGAL